MTCLLRPGRRRGPLASHVVVTVLAAVAALGLTAGPPVHAAARPPGVWPLDPRPAVVHGFDPPDVRWGSGHRGVDLAGRVGQPVRAVLAGTVSFAGRVAGRGVVVVDHGATRTTYQPVAATVRRGEVVARGAVLGTLAWFGTHCLPAACLHWGLIAGDTYLDPLSLVGGPRPVRLLPLQGPPVNGARLVASGSDAAAGAASSRTPARRPDAGGAAASRPPPAAALVALAGAAVGDRRPAS